MTNELYPKGKEKFLNGSISWASDTIKMVLVDTADYTYSDTHEFLSDVPSAGRVATSSALTSKTTTSGAAGCANPTFTAVSGDSAEAIIVYKDTGVEGSSPLIAYIDDNGTMTVTPNGNDIPVLTDNNVLFTL